MYVGQNLTSPVRYCGGLGFFSARAERRCMEAIGFSPECLSIWLDNMHNTKKVCFWVRQLIIHTFTDSVRDNFFKDQGPSIKDVRTRKGIEELLCTMRAIGCVKCQRGRGRGVKYRNVVGVLYGRALSADINLRFQVCLSSWARHEPLNKPDGSLNDCIQCDEDLSGPNFKVCTG